jgi:hypothetical protein
MAFGQGQYALASRTAAIEAFVLTPSIRMPDLEYWHPTTVPDYCPNGRCAPARAQKQQAMKLRRTRRDDTHTQVCKQHWPIRTVAERAAAFDEDFCAITHTIVATNPQHKAADGYSSRRKAEATTSSLGAG